MFTMQTSRYQVQEVSADEAPIELLLEADPSLDRINEYLYKSKCFILSIRGELAAVYVLLSTFPGGYELMNIAVSPQYQRRGIGARLLNHAIATSRELGAHRLEVGTGTFGHQLAFYQKAGFRVFSVERDFFLKNYENPIYENGLQHKDMLRLAIDFEA